MSDHPQSARQGVPPAVRLAGLRLAWSLCALVVVLLGCSPLSDGPGRCWKSPRRGMGRPSLPPGAPVRPSSVPS
jgi:hypothetical protein